MSYSFTTSDGSISFNIPDGTTDTSTGLELPGPNTTGYGQNLNENLVRLLNNFASNTAPQTTNLQGQLWFNKSTQKLNVFTNQGYKDVSGVTNASTQPAIAKDGDIWFDTTRNQTYLYNSGNFNLVGPLYTKAQGISGAIPETVNDGFNVGVTHNIIKLQMGSTVIATVSADASFFPSPVMSGFTTINPGITFRSGINPVINSSLVGSVLGDVVGNLTGNVVATNLSGTLTGNVIGNLTGNVTATTLRGLLLGNFTSSLGQVTNFSTGNALITGGSLSAITNLSASLATLTNINATNLTASNLYSGNIYITGGTLSGISTLGATAATINNLTTSGADITGGSATGLLNASAINLTTTNFSSANTLISGGSINGLTTFSGGTGVVTNFSTANAVVGGGSINSTPVGAAIPSTGAFTILTATQSAITTLALQTLTGPVDANIGSLSAQLASGSGNTAAIQANLGAYQNTTNANIGTLFLGNAATQANLGAFRNSVSANVGTLSTAVVPIGGIILWSGSAASIPSNWRLCDGTSGTPDLRGRFIMGATATVGNVGSTGGTADAVVVAHTHSVTDPGHSHSFAFPVVANPASASVGPPGGYIGGTSLSGTQTNTTAITVNSAGVSGTGQNLPPYYALCYIMRYS